MVKFVFFYKRTEYAGGTISYHAGDFKTFQKTVFSLY